MLLPDQLPEGTLDLRESVENPFQHYIIIIIQVNKKIFHIYRVQIYRCKNGTVKVHKQGIVVHNRILVAAIWAHSYQAYELPGIYLV